MKHTNLGLLRLCGFLAIAAITFTPSVWAASSSRVTGSYQITQKLSIGPRTQVRLKLHFANRGTDNFAIQRIAIWNASHADKGSGQVCNRIVPAGASTDFSQEFSVRRSQFELWKHGTRPQLLIQFQAPNGRIATEIVSLEPVASGKAD